MVMYTALLAFCGGFTARGQSPAVADKAFLDGDWATAAREYLAIVSRDSTNGRANLRLGVSLFELQQFRRAIPALERASAAGFQVNVAEFRMARAMSRLGSLDLGIAHLQRAVDAGISLDLLTTNPDIAPLRQDARYLAVVHRLEDAKFPCRNGTEPRQFDFWVGEWTVSLWGTNGAVTLLAGRSKVTAILEHCVVLEEWTPTQGPNGKSVNFWDTNRKAWRQVWTADDGTSLDYEGHFANGAMRFTGWTLGANGRRVLQKLTFFRVSADTVRQLFEASDDDGKSWKNTFDGRYVRVQH
ncbi:MAG: hypothetical protein ABI625_05420 [bacterium]